MTTPDGFKQAYRQFIDGGWTMLASDPDYGGQGLPAVVATPVEEMWHAANMGFALCQMLTQGAIEAIHLCGSDELKQRYCEDGVRRVDRHDEPHGAPGRLGSERGAHQGGSRGRSPPAVRIEDLHHLRRARLTPKTSSTWCWRVRPTHPRASRVFRCSWCRSSWSTPTAAWVTETTSSACRIEHKLGIHASPTAVLAFGDNGGAVGYLVGEENRGLQYMFIMMNAARFSVGLQGVAIAERAYQHALAYAQGARAGHRAAGVAVATRCRSFAIRTCAAC